MNYKDFLKQKTKSFIKSGFDIDESHLSNHLFDFQKFSVKWALKNGRSALFEDCGLGKTLQQLEWANQVTKKTNKPVLILAPLAVVGQTIQEAKDFDMQCELLLIGASVFGLGVYISNYDQLDNIDTSAFAGVVLDESSILKGKDSKTKNKLLQEFKCTPYKLCCTATPSPNDHMELGNHSEFIGSMSYLEMLAMFFVHDGGETSKWRLRKHAQKDFWQFVSSWGLAIDNPILATAPTETEAIVLKDKQFNQFERDKLKSRLDNDLYNMGLSESSTAQEIGATVLDHNSAELDMQTLLNFDTRFKGTKKKARLDFTKASDDVT